jgi:Tol biopolymer transport system component
VLRLVAALLLVGCGRIGFDATAQGDPDARIDGDGPPEPPDTCTPVLGAPSLLAELAGIGARGPTLTGDGSLLVFGADGAASVDLFSATRDASDQFTNGGPIPGLDTAGTDTDPSISTDGLELFFGHGTCIEVARRATLGAAWSAPQTIPTTCADDGQGAAISADYLALYYTVIVAQPMLAVVRRPDRDSPFGAPEFLGIAGGFPFISSDELTIYFERQVGTDDFDIFRATRGSTAEPFDNIEPVTELNSLFVDEDPHVAPDGIYFSSNRGSGFDLWRAALTCD